MFASAALPPTVDILDRHLDTHAPRAAFWSGVSGVCVGVVTPLLTLAVQMVAATEVRKGRLGSVVHKRLPMVHTGELRAPSSWVDDHIVGVAAASGASLRDPLSSRRLLVAIGSGTELRLQVRTQRIGEGAVPKLLAGLAEVKQVEVHQVRVVAARAGGKELLNPALDEPPHPAGGGGVGESELSQA